MSIQDRLSLPSARQRRSVWFLVDHVKFLRRSIQRPSVFDRLGGASDEEVVPKKVFTLSLC